MLDFIVIGAQKCGTTSLFHYLQSNPNIVMPSSKESPILDRFSNSNEIEKQINALFHKGNGNALKGKISPQYMTNIETTERVCDYAKDRLKVVALLRDPIDRACSHYGMMCARGIERNNIQDALEMALTNVSHGRTLSASPESETSCYVAWSEYERILDGYYQRLGDDRLYVINLSDLKNDPNNSIENLFKFLNIESTTAATDQYEKVYFSAGQHSLLWKLKRLKVTSPIKHIFKLLPYDMRQKTHFWLDEKMTMGAPAHQGKSNLSADLNSELRGHFIREASKYKHDFSSMWS